MTPQVLLPVDIGATDLSPVETIPSRSTDCIHRGEEIARLPCGTCAAAKIKVFHCAITAIGRCQLGNSLAGIHSCDGCEKKAPSHQPPLIKT